MHSPLIAAALCIAVQSASAQCTAPAAVSGSAGTATITPVVSRPAANSEPRSGELIKTAAAGTRDIPVARRGVRPSPDENDHPRRAGTAMLLAALALMSGIALRRFGGPRA